MINCFFIFTKLTRTLANRPELSMGNLIALERHDAPIFCPIGYFWERPAANRTFQDESVTPGKQFQNLAPLAIPSQDQAHNGSLTILDAERTFGG